MINIKTEKLAIRPFQEKDLDLFLKFMLDENATKYLMFTEEQKTIQGATDLFNFVISSYDSANPIHSYVVVDKEDNFIGSCGFSKLYEDKNVYECYYSILPRYWRQGLGTESTRALIKYCFNKLNIDEIRAYMHPDNPMSEGVAKKIGMNYAGIQKHPQFGNEGKMYFIKKEDWK